MKIQVKKHLQSIYDAEAVHETNLTFVMAGAVEYQLTQLDGVFKQQAKKWFTTWLSSARNLWVILDNAMRLDAGYESGKQFYSNRASFIYDCNRILIDLPEEKQNEILSYLKNELEISLENKLLSHSDIKTADVIINAEIN